MRTLGRGCLELLIIWAICGAGLYQYYLGRFEPPGDLYGAIGGGMAVAMAWGSLRNIWQALQQRRLIAAAKTGLRPEDGKPFAAAGMIRALREPLLTPFTKRECVISSYEVYREEVRTTGTGSNRRTDRVKTVALSGYAMTPCAIRTPISDIRVIGFPIPTEFPEEVMSASEYEAQIREYNASTKFTEMKKTEIGKILGKMKEIFQEDDGVLREDWRFPEAEYFLGTGENFDDLLCSEQFVPAGSPVCLLGMYSAQKGGLVHDLASGGLQMFPGDAADAMRALRRRAIGYFVLALFLGTLGTVGGYTILSMRERSDDVQKQYTERLITAVTDGDLAAAERNLRKGASPNISDGSSRALVLRANSQEMVDLLKRNGMDPNYSDRQGFPPILTAINGGNIPMVKMLIAAGANVNIAQPGWGRTPLEAAYDDANWELFEILQQSGGKGLFVTKQDGRVMLQDTEGFLEIANRYVDGLNRSDVEAVRQVTDNWPPDFFESLSRGLYANTHPAESRFRAAFVKPDLATVFLEGTQSSERRVFTFIKRESGWKIRRDGWDEKNLWESVLAELR